jgi:hypothetical protein
MITVTLTFDPATATPAQLYALCLLGMESSRHLHEQMIGPDGKALISPLGVKWAILRAEAEQLDRAAAAMHAELVRREKATADA